MREPPRELALGLRLRVISTNWGVPGERGVLCADTLGADGGTETKVAAWGGVGGCTNIGLGCGAGIGVMDGAGMV